MCAASAPLQQPATNEQFPEFAKTSCTRVRLCFPCPFSNRKVKSQAQQRHPPVWQQHGWARMSLPSRRDSLRIGHSFTVLAGLKLQGEGPQPPWSDRQLRKHCAALFKVRICCATRILTPRRRKTAAQPVSSSNSSSSSYSYSYSYSYPFACSDSCSNCNCYCCRCRYCY